MSPQAETSEKRPNVIWVFGDQHRAQLLSCNGDPNVNTPNIDTFQSFGVNMTAAVAGFPLCCPFRGSLLTSKYPHKCVPGHEYQMDPSNQTIAHVLNDAGYHTAYFGKWHLDGFHEAGHFDRSPDGRAAFHIIPPERRGGFQKWIGYENNNSQWDSWVHGGEGDDAFHERLPGYETDELTNLLIDYLKDRATLRDKGDDQPFFAALSVQPPHDPYVAPPEFMQRHNPQQLELRPNVPRGGRLEETARRDLAGACAQVENLDWNIGRLKTVLQETGLDRDTHILFFSDHGDMHGSHGMLRKTNPFEESIRIPFFITGEKFRYHQLRFGRIDNVPVNHVDIAPTTLGLCGVDVPGWMEGTDYSHYRFRYRGDEMKQKCASEPDSAYIQSVVPTGHGNSIDKPWRGVVTRDGWKYVCFEGIPWLLYNLNEDPYEFANQAHNSSHHAIRRKLNDRLGQWISDTGDEFALPEL